MRWRRASAQAVERLQSGELSSDTYSNALLARRPCPGDGPRRGQVALLAVAGPGHAAGDQGAEVRARVRQAAAFAVQHLPPTDRVGVTVFDEEVETIVPNTLAEDKGRVVDLIQRVQARGSTALHGGWKEGSRQVGEHLLPGAINRVLLLSDGQARVGETNPERIATT